MSAFAKLHLLVLYTVVWQRSEGVSYWNYWQATETNKCDLIWFEGEVVDFIFIPDMRADYF